VKRSPGHAEGGGIIKMLHPPFNFLPSREEKYNVDLFKSGFV